MPYFIGRLHAANRKSKRDEGCALEPITYDVAAMNATGALNREPLKLSILSKELD
jgi:hypothetical protein